MRFFSAALLSVVVLISTSSTSVTGDAPDKVSSAPPIFGFRDAAVETATEARFLAVPDPKLAEAHLRTLTQAPHMAGTPEDKATADYVAQNAGKAGAEQKRNPGKLRDLDDVDGSERPQDPPLLFGEAVIAQRGTELPHHGFAGAQQRHRQRAGEFAHRHPPDGRPVRGFFSRHDRLSAGLQPPK